MFPDSSLIMRLPWPVVLYFPAHSSGSLSHDQHGHNVPSTEREPTPGHLLRFLRVRPEFFSSLSDQWGEFRDDLRDGAMGDPEKIRNDFFNHTLPVVKQHDHEESLPAARGFSAARFPYPRARVGYL